MRKYRRTIILKIHFYWQRKNCIRIDALWKSPNQAIRIFLVFAMRFFFGYCVFRGQSKNLSFWAFYSTMSWIIKMPLFLDQFLFCFNLFFCRFFGRTEKNAFTKNFRRFYKRRWEFHDDLRITFFCCESCNVGQCKVGFIAVSAWWTWIDLVL